jgi:hypothetical protein
MINFFMSPDRNFNGAVSNFGAPSHCVSDICGGWLLLAGKGAEARSCISPTRTAIFRRDYADKFLICKNLSA